MIADYCDIVSELTARGLDHLVVRILAYSGITTVTACLLVSSAWSSQLRYIWRQLYSQRKRCQPVFRNYCGLAGCGTENGNRDQVVQSEYKRVLLGFRKWTYFSKCSFSTETVPTCFKYQRSKLYFGTTDGDLNMIDFGNHNAARTLSSTAHGRIFSIDIKDDILVTGHADGSIRITPGLGPASTLQLPEGPLVLTKILSNEGGAARLLVWARTGGCFLVNSLTDINLIGRFSTEDSFIQANEYQIVVINSISLNVDIYNSTTGEFLADFLLEAESPVSSDLVGKLLFVGFKQNIEVWDLKNMKRITTLIISSNTMAPLGVLRCNEIYLYGLLTDGTLILWSLLDIFQEESQKCEAQTLIGLDVAWRNMLEVSDNKVVFASERKLGDFHILHRLK